MYLFNKLLLTKSKLLCLFTRNISFMLNYMISLERIVIRIQYFRNRRIFREPTDDGNRGRTVIDILYCTL
jgi:hypothetical protein